MPRDPRFLTGAIPTPRHKLAAAPPFRQVRDTPPQFAWLAPQLSMWGNSQYGDCVSAEEAAAKAVYSVGCGLPETFVAEADVIAWARKYGFLNGAMLTDVMDQMAKNGMPANGQTWEDGPYKAVDYSNEAALQNAIGTVGPLKVGIDSSALPSGAGNNQGWTAFGGSPHSHTNEDHCVGLYAYGPSAWLLAQINAVMRTNATLPSNAPPTSYVLYTWSTFGLVDHDWIMSTMGEAWVRNPTTLGQTPVPQQVDFVNL